MKYTIASANGYGNAGDDICMVSCETIIKRCDPAASITVTSPPFVEDAVKNTDFIVLGGGGIIYDANKANMENYLQYVEYGIKHGKKTAALGVGEQGIVTKEGASRYADVLGKSNLVTVRSKTDAERMKKIGITNVIATQDLAFSYDYRPYAKMSKALELKGRIQRRLQSKARIVGKKKLGIVLSNQEHMVNDLKLAFSKKEKENALHFRESLGAHLDSITKNYDVTLIVQSRDDVGLAAEYAYRYKLKVHTYKKVGDLKKLLRTFAKQDIILTQRFHGVVFSLQIGVPVIALGYYGQKQYKLLKDLGAEDKLVMYHQPEQIEKLVDRLSSGSSVKEFFLENNESMATKIRELSLQNETLLKKAIVSDKAVR